MDRVETNNWQWKFIAEENGKRMATHECPESIVGDIIKVIAMAQIGDACTPTREVKEQLQYLIEKKFVSLHIVCAATGIKEEVLQRLLDGIMEPIDTEKMVILANMIDRLNKAPE